MRMIDDLKIGIGGLVRIGSCAKILNGGCVAIGLLIGTSSLVCGVFDEENLLKKVYLNFERYFGYVVRRPRSHGIA